MTAGDCFALCQDLEDDWGPEIPCRWTGIWGSGQCGGSEISVFDCPAADESPPGAQEMGCGAGFLCCIAKGDGSGEDDCIETGGDAGGVNIDSKEDCEGLGGTVRSTTMVFADEFGDIVSQSIGCNNDDSGGSKCNSCGGRCCQSKGSGGSCDCEEALGGSASQGMECCGGEGNLTGLNECREVRGDNWGGGRREAKGKTDCDNLPSSSVCGGGSYEGCDACNDAAGGIGPEPCNMNREEETCGNYLDITGLCCMACPPDENNQSCDCGANQHHNDGHCTDYLNTDGTSIPGSAGGKKDIFASEEECNILGGQFIGTRNQICAGLGDVNPAWCDETADSGWETHAPDLGGWPMCDELTNDTCMGFAPQPLWPNEPNPSCGPQFVASIDNNFDVDTEIHEMYCDECCSYMEECMEADLCENFPRIGKMPYMACTCGSECHPGGCPCSCFSQTGNWGCPGMAGFPDCACHDEGGDGSDGSDGDGPGGADSDSIGGSDSDSVGFAGRGGGDWYECVTDISEQECIDALGQWNPFGECTGECDDLGEECTNNGDELCINPCCGSIACCKDGSCIGDTEGSYDPEFPEKRLPPLSKMTCEYVYGGIAVPGVCGDEVDCCNATIYVGACCVDESCEVTTAKNCKNSNGIFMGPNSNCETVNCCIPGGACCLEDFTCMDVADEQACMDMGGEYRGDGTDCESVNCSGIGACCYPGGVCDDENTEQECSGVWRGEGTCCSG